MSLIQLDSSIRKARISALRFGSVMKYANCNVRFSRFRFKSHCTDNVAVPVVFALQIGSTTSFGSVVMTVKVSRSVPALRSFHLSHRPASAYGWPSFHSDRERLLRLRVQLLVE
jgi:hypothetical protein